MIYISDIQVGYYEDDDSYYGPFKETFRINAPSIDEAVLRAEEHLRTSMDELHQSMPSGEITAIHDEAGDTWHLTYDYASGKRRAVRVVPTMKPRIENEGAMANAEETSAQRLDVLGENAKSVNESPVPCRCAAPVEQWDVFICHASEDKRSFVQPLADALKKAGLKVWYDRFELKLGDSLREKIDQGLAKSQYGIVVASKAFFKKRWPQSELDGLVARQNSEGRKVILPILHQIAPKDVIQFSPSLAGRLAVESKQGLEAVVAQIMAVVKDET